MTGTRRLIRGSLGCATLPLLATSTAAEELRPLSTSVGHELFGPVAAFIEIAGVYSTQADADYVLLADGGPVVLVTDYVQLDAAAGVELTDAAGDFTLFTGVSFKL